MLARVSRWIFPPLALAAALLVYRLALVPAAGLDRTGIDLPGAAAARIEPPHREPRIATDAQLAEVLARLKPPAGRVMTNTWLHALRLWGPDARFDEHTPSGSTMLAYFLDDAEFRKHAGADAPPLLEIDGPSVRVRNFDDDDENQASSSHHSDDILATLAECGVPLATPVIGRGAQTTVGDLYLSAMREFHLQKFEYEWSAISYFRYGHGSGPWYNKYGQRIDPSQIIEELTGHPLPNGPCNGTHRLEALAVLLRADHQSPVLSRTERGKVAEYLRQVGVLLSATQSPEGYWTRTWSAGHPPADDDPATIYDRILVTGHHLEWLALAPAETHPPREQIVRAGQWLVRAITELDPAVIESKYGPLSHAARALCLWRGGEAWPVWRSLQTPEH